MPYHHDSLVAKFNGDSCSGHKSPNMTDRWIPQPYGQGWATYLWRGGWDCDHSSLQSQSWAQRGQGWPYCSSAHNQTWSICRTRRGGQWNKLPRSGVFSYWRPHKSNSCSKDHSHTGVSWRNPTHPEAELATGSEDPVMDLLCDMNMYQDAAIEYKNAYKALKDRYSEQASWMQEACAALFTVENNASQR